MKLLLIIIVFIIAAVLTGCTITSTPDGSFTGAVDSASAIALANQIFSEK